MVPSAKGVFSGLFGALAKKSVSQNRSWNPVAAGWVMFQLKWNPGAECQNLLVPSASAARSRNPVPDEEGEPVWDGLMMPDRATGRLDVSTASGAAVLVGVCTQNTHQGGF